MTASTRPKTITGQNGDGLLIKERAGKVFRANTRAPAHPASETCLLRAPRHGTPRPLTGRRQATLRVRDICPRIIDASGSSLRSASIAPAWMNGGAP